MINSIIPLANWGMGTALIIFFAVLCVGLSAIVINFVMGGNKSHDENVNSEKEEK